MSARLSNPAAAKDPRRTWYGLALWKERRRHQLRIEPLCCLCEADGRITGATVADHHPADEGDYNKFVLGELRSLCAACHDALQGFKHKGYSTEIGLDGYPVDAAHPFYRSGG